MSAMSDLDIRSATRLALTPAERAILAEGRGGGRPPDEDDDDAPPPAPRVTRTLLPEHRPRPESLRSLNEAADTLWAFVWLARFPEARASLSPAEFMRRLNEAEHKALVVLRANGSPRFVNVLGHVVENHTFAGLQVREAVDAYRLAVPVVFPTPLPAPGPGPRDEELGPLAAPCGCAACLERGQRAEGR